MSLVNQLSAAPTRKVAAGTISGGVVGAAATLLVWLTDNQLSIEEASAATVLGQFIGAWESDWLN